MSPTGGQLPGDAGPSHSNDGPHPEPPNTRPGRVRRRRAIARDWHLPTRPPTQHPTPTATGRPASREQTPRPEDLPRATPRPAAATPQPPPLQARPPHPQFFATPHSSHASAPEPVNPYSAPSLHTATRNHVCQTQTAVAPECGAPKYASLALISPAALVDSSHTHELTIRPNRCSGKATPSRSGSSPRRPRNGKSSPEATGDPHPPRSERQGRCSGAQTKSEAELNAARSG